MRILNIMLGRGRGGLEQAAIDYHEALSLCGHHVISVLHPNAAIRSEINSLQGDTLFLSALSEWDLFAAWRLRRLAKKAEADVIIAHGNRAIGLALRAHPSGVPIIGVAHNYNIKKRFPRCDAVLCITRDLFEEMVHLDIPRTRLYHIPNMVRILDAPARPHFQSPPVIASMGRFVPKKGFDVLLHGLRALKDYGVDFRAVIGGEGLEADALKKLSIQLGIEHQVTFPGWVEDAHQFFSEADIFVLPSQHEPFGIVLIEAMAAGLPCITTDTEGPCEIITEGVTARMVEKAKPYQMAKAMQELLEEPFAAQAMGIAAAAYIRHTYALEVVAPRLSQAAEAVLASAQEAHT